MPLGVIGRGRRGREPWWPGGGDPGRACRSILPAMPGTRLDRRRPAGAPYAAPAGRQNGGRCNVPALPFGEILRGARQARATFPTASATRAPLRGSAGSPRHRSVQEAGRTARQEAPRVCRARRGSRLRPPRRSRPGRVHGKARQRRAGLYLFVMPPRAPPTNNPSERLPRGRPSCARSGAHCPRWPARGRSARRRRAGRPGGCTACGRPPIQGVH